MDETLDYPEDSIIIAIDRQLGNSWSQKGFYKPINDWDFDEIRVFNSDARVDVYIDPTDLIDSAIDQKYHFQEWYMERYINNHNGNNGGLKCIPLKTSGKRGLIRR